MTDFLKYKENNGGGEEITMHGPVYRCTGIQSSS